MEPTRTKQRSPNYPAVDLGGAIENARQLWANAGRRRVSQNTAVQAWRYGTLSGPARSRLAALRQYGLIEVDKDGDVALTKRGQVLAYGADHTSPDYAQALKEAALAPEIFRDLYDTRRLSSDESIRRHLVLERKFSEDGAKKLIESFRSTLALANLDKGSYHEDMNETGGATDAEIGLSSGHLGGRNPRQDDPPSIRKESFRWPLYDDVVAEVTFYGSPFTPDDIDLLGDYLKTAQKARQRPARPAQVGTPPAQTPLAILAATSDNANGPDDE